MNEELTNIISQSNFEVVQGSFVYVKVSSLPKSDEHFMVTQDNDEITVVTKQENITKLEVVERNKDNYTLIALNVSIPFYSVGLLATVSEAIAKEGMNILIVSTYSKDYIMVREDKLNEGIKVLKGLGFNEK